MRAAACNMPSSEHFIWTRESVQKVIELYREHDCLWRINIKAYKSRNMKEAAINDIKNKLLQLHPGIDVEKIKSKIQFFSFFSAASQAELQEPETLHHSPSRLSHFALPVVF